jgi:zinc/manganese transport system substrate-binding protein
MTLGHLGRVLLVALLLGALPRLALAKLKVAATVPDLAALAQAVGGDRVEVFSLTLPTQDPHFCDARPHLALKLNRADLLLLVGLQLETAWLPVLLTGSRNPAIQRGSAGYLDVSSVVQLKDVPRVKVDRSMGDIHPGGNPHYLVDPQNAERVARAIATRLAKLDSAAGQTYEANARAFSDKLRAARARWASALRPYRGTKVVTYHRSWIYLTDALGLKIVEQLEPKPGIPPNAAHVLRVIQTIRAERAPLLLQEEYYPDRTARLVAEKTGARLLILPGGARLDRAESYLARMESLVNQVVTALKETRR